MRQILIVEDEFGIADVLNDILTEEGHEVRVARNGQEGLRLADERAPDLILLDLMMPVMDGRSMLQQLRVTSGLKHIPVLLMSAVPEAAALKGCDADGFLQKPFDLNNLLEHIERLKPRAKD
jgi:DNA-binding response OmpR family regulator